MVMPLWIIALLLVVALGFWGYQIMDSTTRASATATAQKEETRLALAAQATSSAQAFKTNAAHETNTAHANETGAAQATSTAYVVETNAAQFARTQTSQAHATELAIAFQAKKTAEANATRIAQAEFTATGVARATATESTRLTATAQARATATARAARAALSARQTQTSIALAKGKLVTVYAAREWQDTQVYIENGKTVKVSYVSGQWSTFGDFMFGPTGRNIEPLDWPDNVLKGYQHGSLIGEYDSVDPFYIGAELTFIAQSNGNLLLRVNDRQTSDNSGSLQILMTIE